MNDQVCTSALELALFHKYNENATILNTNDIRYKYNDIKNNYGQRFSAKSYGIERRLEVGSDRWCWKDAIS